MVAQGEFASEMHEAIRRGERQRPQHDRVEYAKNGGVGTDAEGEGEDDDSGKAVRLAQHAEAVANVLEQRFDEMGAQGFAALFGEFLIATKVEAGAALGFGTRNA